MNSRRLDVFLDQTPPVVTTRYQALKQRNKNKLTLKNCHSICLSKFFKDAPISDHFQGWWHADKYLSIKNKTKYLLGEWEAQDRNSIDASDMPDAGEPLD